MNNAPITPNFDLGFPFKPARKKTPSNSTETPIKLQPLTIEETGYKDLLWTWFSPHIATLSSAENPYHWEGGFITYIGYPNKATATTAMKHLLWHHKASDVELRKGRRMKKKGIRWELKIWGLSLGEVMKLATLDLDTNPAS